MNQSKDDAEFDPFAHDTGRNKGGGAAAGVAWLALLLVLGLAGLNGYQWWQERALQADGASLQRSLDRLRSGQAGLQDDIRALEARLDAVEQSGAGSELAELRSEIQSLQSSFIELGEQGLDTQAQLDAGQAAMIRLQQRIDALEANMAGIAARASEPARSADITEIGYLLRLAAERLALFGDVRSADQALALADAHLEALDDSVYLPVRRSISASRQALQALPVPDLAALSARLSTLQGGIDALPFPGETPAVSESSDPESPGDDPSLWQRFKSTLAPLVKVRRRVDQDSLPSLEDKDFLRQGLWLQFESARLALMRHDAASWDHALRQARDNLAGRFDATSRPVRDMLAEVERLRAIELETQLPDISAAAAQLRLLDNGGDAPAAPPESAGDGGE
ncbi:MAG TPA: uroporphyrinogen-III C-methyltransferase [Xanthomonadales bacterium]|nr:uroporphyrinogen-III C-methyltransferase [Xanthomonadales bacterium]